MVLVDMSSGSVGKDSSIMRLCFIVTLSIGFLSPCDGTNLKLGTHPEKDVYPANRYPLVRNLVSIDHGGDFDRLRTDKSNGKAREKRQIKEPMINSITPTFGQVIGNVLQLHGDNFMLFGGGEVVVQIGRDTPCSCFRNNLNLTSCYNNNYLLCLYKNSTGSLDTPLSVTIEYENGTIYSGPNVTYTFKKNAIITDASPRKTIQRGGTKMNITGRNFHPQYKMDIILTTFTGGRQYGPESKRACQITNETRALCITPRVYVPNSLSWGNRRKRQTTTFCRTDSYLNVKISFVVERVEQKFTPENGTNDLCMAMDPDLENYEDDIYKFKIYDGEKQLRIEGQRLDYGVHRDDYQVFVGNSSCNITDLLTKLLICTPPPQVPTDIPNEFKKNGLPMLRVLIGTELNSSLAYIDYQFVKPIDINIEAIVGGVLGGLTAILIGIVIFWQCRKQDKIQEKALHIVEREDQDYTRLMQEENRSLLDLLDENLRQLIMDCSLKSQKLTRNKEIGSGHYGKVFSGTLAHEEQPKLRGQKVAVKTIKDDGVSLTQIREFLKEAELMKDLKHPNVLDLIGIVLEDNKPYVVLPLMEKGNLKSYVSNKQRKFEEVDLINVCIQVAQGMTFLSEQRIIHRDLRAVNCLVDKNALIKIADFGLSRDSYGDAYYRVNDKDRPLPVKWMAPEALEGYDVTSALDVWSYGVLMWEVFTRGCTPYADVPNHEMKDYIRTGRRLEKPSLCTSDELYEVMLSCWEGNPKNRKTFKEIVEKLNGFIQPTATMTNKENANIEGNPNATSKDIGPVHRPPAPSDSYFVPRDSTYPNEYIKTPRLEHDYLAVLGEDVCATMTDIRPLARSDSYFVPRESTYVNENIGDDPNPAPLAHRSNMGTEYDVPPNNKPVLLDSDVYLTPEPSRYQNIPHEKEQFVPSKNETLDLKEENDESYMSPVRREKVEAGLNQPRGFLYQNSSEVQDGYEGDNTLYDTPKATNVAEANFNHLDYDHEMSNFAPIEKKPYDEEIPPTYNPATSDKENVYVNQQMTKVAANSKRGDVSIANGKVTTTQNPDLRKKEEVYMNQQMSKVAANSRSTQLPKDSGETVNLDIQSLVSRLANDPEESHNITSF